MAVAVYFQNLDYDWRLGLVGIAVPLLLVDRFGKRQTGPVWTITQPPAAARLDSPENK